MMQEKNNLDDMAKKYKEEMMRLYSRKPKPAVSAPPPKQTSQAAADQPAARNSSAKESAARIMPVQTSAKPVQTVSTPVHTAEKHILARHEYSEQLSEADIRDLSNPPMPDIPQNYQDAGIKKTAAPNVSSSKFPSADEILRNENSTVFGSAQTHQPAAVVQETRSIILEEHNQGNYNAANQLVPQNGDTSDVSELRKINESYPDKNTDFSAVDTGEDFSNENPPDMSGQGYLQIEVTTASGAIPVRDATVIITESNNGEESLIGMVVTDENGTTPIVPLPAPPQSLSEAPDPSEKPYSEYNISVYKKGFYSIPQLTVPIFDTIKSIQPVSVIPLAEFEFNGAEIPNERR
ncbi:MAG: hypothetical protein K2J73_08435 [Oscillospiraceae bacterium]|nr:hypothetical protein [Oscillospiraceae bacterium]